MSNSDQTQLSIGDTAPAFTLPDSDGNKVSLSDFRGQHVIVYFYPAAGTPGCTTEACDFRDNLAELNNAGYQILGISPDTPDKLAEFATNENLTFPLLADPEKTTLQAWGAFGEKNNYGKVVQGVIRSTFVVAPDGTIAKAAYNVQATGHVARLIRDLEIAA